MSNIAASLAGLAAAPHFHAPDSAGAIFSAAERLLPDLERGRRVDAAALRTAMEHAMRDRLKAYGLFNEIISWKLRMFVPTDASDIGVLAKVLERYSIERVREREAA
jgi:hypothetical protein